MVARRMHRTSGKPQQPASPANLAPNRARTHCSGNGLNGIHRRAPQHPFSEKESHGLGPGQISDPDRARRGVRRTSKKSAGDSIGAPPQQPGSEEDMPRAAALPRRREQTSTDSCERGGTASSPPARFPAELLACGALAAGAAADVLRSGKPPGAGRRGRKTTGEDLA